MQFQPIIRLVLVKNKIQRLDGLSAISILWDKNVVCNISFKYINAM